MRMLATCAVMALFALPAVAVAADGPGQTNGARGMPTLVSAAVQICKAQIVQQAGAGDQVSREALGRCVRKLLGKPWQLMHVIRSCKGSAIGDGNRVSVLRCVLVRFADMAKTGTGGSTTPPTGGDSPKGPTTGGGDPPLTGAIAAALAACKAEQVDPGFAAAHGGTSFGAFYGGDAGEREALGRCLKVKLQVTSGGPSGDGGSPPVSDPPKPDPTVAALAACKAEQADPGFAAAHGGTSFGAFYGGDAGEHEALGHCVTAKLSAGGE